jgi:hypothetical protein
MPPDAALKRILIELRRADAGTKREGQKVNMRDESAESTLWIHQSL